MNNNPILKIDWILLFASVGLIATGILFIYSSGINSAGQLVSNEYLRQIIWMVLGLILMVVLAYVKYDVFRDLAPIIYVVFLLLILVTIFVGKVVNGAKSWLGIGELGIQPSEFMKIAVILMLARSFEASKLDEMSLGTLSKKFILVLLPMGLILLQPDLGTALVFIPIFLFIAQTAGVNVKYMLFILLTGALCIAFTLLPAWNEYLNKASIPYLAIFSDKLMVLLVSATFLVVSAVAFVGWLRLKRIVLYLISFCSSSLLIAFVFSFIIRNVLKGYQIQRLIVFIDPYFDARGSGWNIIQSVTAIGSGGAWGKGYLQGTQSHLRYLPEQSTDFIFSIISEELGFVGAILIFALFTTILIRGLYIAYKAKDSFGAFIASGVVGFLFFHMLINIGMTIGTMPITGIPLLFVSYGGSSLWTALIGVGLLMNVNSNRYQF